MPDTSPILGLPYIQPAQAQKHVTHNEALRLLDVLVQPRVLDRSRNAPPPTPAEGDRHIVGPAPTGEWAGQAGRIALREDGGWTMIEPQPGWSVQVLDEAQEVVFRAGAWTGGSDGPLQVAALGVAAAPDGFNRLTVEGPATLLTGGTGGHQLKLNKAAAGDTASLLFQTGFSGRAEMGTVGDDAFVVKVSADGATFHEGLRLSTGALQIDVPVTGTAVTADATDATAGRLMRVGDFGLGGPSRRLADAGPTDASIASGAYHIDTALGSAGGPATVARGSVQHNRRAAAGGETQILVVEEDGGGIGAGTVFSRGRAAAGWGAWRRLYDDRNLVGTVSGSAAPFGAVFERGGNANGQYRRTACGGQWCVSGAIAVASASVALGGLFRSADVIWTYPAAFDAADGPVVTGMVADADAWITLVSAGATQAVFRVVSAVSKAAALSVRLTAQGRWVI